MIQEKLQEQIDRMLDKGVLELAETPSVWNSPVMCVPKAIKKSQKHMRNMDTKGVSFRPVVDFRWVNSQMMTKRIQIPCITTLIDTIAQKKNKLLSVCDIKDSFFNFELHPNSRPITQFTFRGITYQFQRLPQGAADSPFVNQFYVSKILKPILNKSTLVYVDDCITYSKDFDSHLRDIDEMLTLLEEAGLKLSPAKCEFFKTDVTYLGFELSGNTIRPNKTHGNAMASYPTPTTKKQLKTFIGACLFLKSHIPDRGPLLKPLIDLASKSATWEWTETHQKFFDTVKNLLATRPILRLPDWDKPFEIVSDASDDHCGVALLQRDDDGNFCPISYNGRSFRGSEQNWDVHTKEAFGMIFAVTTYRHYLLHRQFTVWTDNSAVSHIFGNKNRQNARVLRWQLLLSEYDYVIKHLKGENNGLSDALSRIVHPYWSPADNKIRDFPYVPGTDNTNNTLTSCDPPTHPQVVAMDDPAHNSQVANKAPVSCSSDSDTDTTHSNSCMSVLSNSLSSLCSDYNEDDFVSHDVHRYLEPLTSLISRMNGPPNKSCDDSIAQENHAHYYSEYQHSHLSTAGIIFSHISRDPSPASLLDTSSVPIIHDLNPLTRAQVKRLQAENDDKQGDDTHKQFPFANEDKLDPQLYQHKQTSPRLPHSKALNRNRITSTPTSDGHVDMPTTNKPQTLQDELSPLGMFDKNTILREQKKEQYIVDIINYLEKDVLPPTKRRQLSTMTKADYHCLIDGVLYNIRPTQPHANLPTPLRLVVPNALVPTLLHNYHDSVTGSHTGIARMITNVQRNYYFPKMVAMITRHVQTCHKCNLAKSSKRYTSPRSIHDYSDVPFTYLSIDAVGPVDATPSGNRYIMVLVCHTSNYVIAWPQRNLTANVTIQKLIDIVFNVYGYPAKLLSDNGSPFNSHMWADMCKVLNIYG